MRKFGAFVLVCLQAVSCGKRDTVDTAEESSSTTSTGGVAASAPSIPPAGSIELGLSLGLTQSAYGLVSSNKIEAQGALLLTSIAAFAAMAVPAAALKSALDADATFSDGAYHWNYSAAQGGKDYDIHLSAVKQLNESVSWVMQVTLDPANSDGCCDNFTFMTGTTESDGNKGAWTIYDPKQPADDVEGLLVTYDMVDATATSRKIELAKDAGDGWLLGGFIEINKTGDDNSVTVDRNPGNDAIGRITWNDAADTGKYLKENGDEICWEGDANATCPAD